MSQRFVRKRKQSILVVDDDRETLRMLNCILEPEEYDVIIAPNGSSAVALLDEHGPDLIILDVMTPKLDGFQVLTLIRQRSTVPVIMLSARREVTTLCKALVLGADDCVTKPFRRGELLARIRAKLRRAAPGTHSSASPAPTTLRIGQPGPSQ